MNKKKILEYGSGNSSLYYLRRGAIVTSVEDDQAWFKKVKLKSNMQHNYIFAQTEKQYVYRKEIEDADIIVIDGTHRAMCKDYVVSMINNGKSNPSMVIFDNSDWYESTIRDFDSELGWHRIDFCGLGPINGYTWVTSVYLNPNRVMSRVNNFISSLSGIVGRTE